MVRILIRGDVLKNSLFNRGIIRAKEAALEDRVRNPGDSINRRISEHENFAINEVLRWFSDQNTTRQIQDYLSGQVTHYRDSSTVMRTHDT